MKTEEVLEIILSQIRAVSQIFENSSAGKLSYNEISEKLSDIMQANVYIISVKGKVMGIHCKDMEDNTAVYDPDSGGEYMPEAENKAFLSVKETTVKENALSLFELFEHIPADRSHKKPHMIVPVYGGGIRQGTILFARYEPFQTKDMILGEHVATAIGVELERRKKRAIEEKHRKENAAQMALEGLTYSEQVVVRDIFQQLRGESDLVVASKVADRAKVARSLVVSALRKLESAGMIEAHSYGPKGTWIKVLNDRFRDKIMAEDL